MATIQIPITIVCVSETNAKPVWIAWTYWTYWSPEAELVAWEYRSGSAIVSTDKKSLEELLAKYPSPVITVPYAPETLQTPMSSNKVLEIFSKWGQMHKAALSGLAQLIDETDHNKIEA